MKKHCLLLTFACLFALQAVYAQNALRLSPYNTSQIPASISIGDTFAFDVWVHNDSAFAYNDTVDFTIQIQHGDTFTQFLPDINSGFSWDRIIIPIPAFDSVILSITTNVTPPAFKTGPSVVIIWPRALGVTGTGFSQSFGTILTIDEASNSNMKFAIQQNILTISQSAEIEINALKLYDLTGKLLYETQNPANQVPLPLYQHGSYIAEITYNRNQLKIFRFNY